jgi:membrane protein DedA with SNARE-associated domain
LPAGVAKMPLVRFTVFSLIGATPWVVALTLAGYAAGGNWTSVRKGFEYATYVILVLIVLGALYAVVQRRRGRRRAEGSRDAPPVSDAG